MPTLGWLEWDGVIGPRGRMYAEGRLLPTLECRWQHQCRNRPEGCQSATHPSGHDQDIEAIFALENGFYVLLMGMWDWWDDDPTWSIVMVLLSYYAPEDPYSRHAPEKHIVTALRPTEDGGLEAVIEADNGLNSDLPVDPEGYEDIMTTLRLWSSVRRPKEVSAE